MLGRRTTQIQHPSFKPFLFNLKSRAPGNGNGIPAAFEVPNQINRAQACVPNAEAIPFIILRHSWD